MEKIRLSKTEKRMMLMLSEYGAEALHDFSATEASIAVRSLQHKGLAKGAFIEGGLLESATITALGRTKVIFLDWLISLSSITSPNLYF